MMQMTNQKIVEKINQRRRQILIHSVIYYKLNDSLISDSTWSRWAIELYNLQKDYPEIAETVPYHNAFKDFDPSTGCNLPLDDEWAVGTALYLLRLHDKRL